MKHMKIMKVNLGFPNLVFMRFMPFMFPGF